MVVKDDDGFSVSVDLTDDEESLMYGVYEDGPYEGLTIEIPEIVQAEIMENYL